MIQITNKEKIIVTSFLVYSVALVAIGRYTTPEKIKIVTTTVTVTKQQDTTKEEVKKKRRKKVVIVEDKKPNGEDVKTTTITDDINSDKDIDTTKKDSTNTKTNTSKEVTKGSDKVTLSFMTGAQFNLSNGSPLVYGLALTKPVLGPVTLGVWGLNNLTFGFSLGLTF